MDTSLGTSPASHQTNATPNARSNRDENSQARSINVCAFPYSHQNLVREIEALERALVDERSVRRQQEFRFTLLMVDVAVWALSRLETDYQIRVNNGESVIFLSQI